VALSKKIFDWRGGFAYNPAAIGAFIGSMVAVDIDVTADEPNNRSTFGFHVCFTACKT
jgi:hypothetical protein